MIDTQIAGLVIGSAIASGTPVLYATTGEVLAQRSGIINLGLEGSMLAGAVAAAWAYSLTANVTVAVLAGGLAGGFLGLMHAVFVVIARLGMLASGLCIFFIGRGVSAFAGYSLTGQSLVGMWPLKIPVLSQIPVLGTALFSQDALVYLAVLVAVAMWWLLFRTRIGLMIRATGENAEIARSQGVPVARLRIIAVATGAALAGVGGAHIVLAFSHSWLEGVTAGRGWVAIGMVILARWNPLYALPIAYLFGGVIAIQLNAQAAGISISPYLLSMLPYVLTIIALIFMRIWTGSSGLPAELAHSSQ